MTSRPADDSELELVSSRVLMRDAARTDYIVLPLAAGVLARLVLATPVEEVGDDELRELLPALRESATSIVALSDESAMPRWASEPAVYGEVAAFALEAWVAFDLWLPAGFAATVFQSAESTAPRAWLQNTTEWLEEHDDASLLTTMLVSALGLYGLDTRRNEHPFVARGARGLRVLLARRLRERGLTTWPAVLRAAIDSWTLDAVERHALQLSRTATEMFFAAADASEAALSAEDELAAVTQAAAVLGPAASTPASAPRQAMTPEVRTLEARNETLRQQLHTLRRKLDEQAHRESRSESRAAALTEELQSARQTIGELELQVVMLKAERDQLAEQIAVDAALAPEAPATGTTALAGRDIVLYTGQAAADVRQAMEQSFYALGARHVTCYWTQKTRGPSRVPADTLVVVDVTFMSHSDSEVIQAMAQRSQSPLFLCRRGTSVIAREVATRLEARMRGLSGQ